MFLIKQERFTPEVQCITAVICCYRGMQISILSAGLFVKSFTYGA